MILNNLGSGSKGNATIIENEGTNILVDAGLTYKQLMVRSDKRIDEINAILITHEHTDHISALPVLLNKVNVPVYISSKSYERLNDNLKKQINELRIIKPYETFKIGSIDILPLQLFHDSVDCLGFVFTSSNKKVVYITDTGFIHHEVMDKIMDANLYFIEANHDIFLLMNSDRPYDLKVRILGDRGHLSNIDASSAICYACGKNTSQIVFGHISAECNTVENIKKTAIETFESFGISFDMFEVYYANQDNKTIIEVK